MNERTADRKNPPKAFRYTEPQWTNIVEQLPATDESWEAQHKKDLLAEGYRSKEQFLDTIRHSLERVATLYLNKTTAASAGKIYFGDSSEKNSIKRLSKQLASFQSELLTWYNKNTDYIHLYKLPDDISESEGHRGVQEVLHQIAKELNVLQTILLQRQKYLEKLPSSNAEDPGFKILFIDMMELWISRGGEPRISGVGKDTPAGPLLRYLHAVTDPIRKAEGRPSKTSAALGDMVVRYRKGQLMKELLPSKDMKFRTTIPKFISLLL